MIAYGLLLGAVFSALNGFVFSLVGNVVSKRRLAGDDATANWAFVVWWYTLGGLSFVGSAFSVAGAFGYTDLSLHTTLLLVVILVLCVSLWGLGYYFVYLFTGKRRWMTWLAGFYLFYYVLLTYLIVDAHPTGVVIRKYSTELKYAQDFSDNPYIGVLTLFLIAPQVIGGIGYLSLYFRVRSAVQRYRISLVAGSILVWFLSSIGAGLLGLPDRFEWWSLVSQTISVLASCGVLLAFSPPEQTVRWLQARDSRAQGGPA